MNDTRAEDAQRESVARLAAEAQVLARLNEASLRLWRARSVSDGLNEMLAASTELLGADKGSIHLLDETRKVLVIAVQSRFERAFLQYFREVSAEDGTAPGQALRMGERIVIEDVETDESSAPWREVARAAGYRAVQSTPLIGQDGAPLGILSTYFEAAHRPGEHELRWLDLYVQQAVGFLERVQAEEALRASKERYRAILDSQSEAVCRFRPDGTILFVNGAYARARGTTPAALIGRNFWGFIPETDRPSVRAALDRLTPNAPEARIENRFETTEGPCWTLWTNRALTFDADGRWLEAQSTGLDITQRKEAEERLRRSEQELDDTFESASIGLHWADPGGIIQRVNRAELDLLGYTREEYVGRHLAEFHADRAVADEILARLLRGETLRDYPARLRCKDGSTRDVLINSSAYFENSTFIHSRCFTHDITARKQAEEALQAKEAELELVARTTPLILVRCSRDLRYQFINHAGAALFGLTPDQIMGRPIVEIMGERAFLIIKPHVDRVLRGEQVDYEAEVPYPVAGPRWMRISYTPSLDDHGDVTGWVSSIIDVTDRRRAEEALRESEERFRLMANAAPVMIWISGTDKLCTWFNKPWLDFVGRPMERELGNGWTENLYPDDYAGCLKIYVEAFDAREPFSMEYRLRRHDGEYRWLLDNGVPRYGMDGAFVGYIGSCLDITARKHVEQQQAILINELNHRVKNTLATVQSFAAQTFRNTERSGDAHEVLEARLAALSRAHDVLTRRSWEGADLREIVQRALEAFQTSGRLRTEGVDVRLTPKQALTLAMALHELGTNAAKYGALSNSSGQVRFDWRVASGDDGKRLQLRWAEERGPPVSRPRRKGFGSRLIEENLARDLDGQVMLEYRHEGVVCTIECPIQDPSSDGFASKESDA